MATLLLLVVACSPLGPWEAIEEGGGTVGPRIVVSPGALDFGVLSVNADGSASLPLTLYNLGDAPETLSGHDEPLGSAAFSVLADPLIELGPGAELTVEVVFTPETDATYTAELLVEPVGEVVRLEGAATAPVLEVGDPTFAPVVLGCSGEGEVPVANTGSEPLAFGDAGVSSGEFELVELPGELEPGAEGAVRVRFTPAGGGARGTTLLLRTNDPARPEVGVALSVLGYEGERVTEAFRFSPTNPTDVLFVVDTGASMDTQLPKADAAVPAYVEALREANLDYQLVALSSADACPDALGFATRSDTSLVAERVVASGFTGGGGPWQDDLLGLADAALDETGAGGCLEGFRREDADLQVVVVTDGPAQGDVGAAADGLAERVDASLRVSVLVPESDCGGRQESYAAVAERYGGTVEDLCAPDWTEAFLTFASLPAGDAAVRFPLSEAPVVSTLEVDVEGAAWSDWSYDEAENAVVFDGGQTPALGAEVTITYVSAVACE